ncbi:MAG: PepSY domain-containing protein [Oscillospiraceae bacterium]
MKTEVLLRSIGKISDELIADAESEANTKRKPGWAKLGTMAACLALVLCTGIATHAIRSNATAGTFTMDVNPSVEYTIAKSGAVKSIRSLNSDADAALSGIVPGRQSVEAALTRTVAAYEACGYMKNGEATVLISFDSRLDANAELKASLSAEIQQTLEQTDAVGTLIFHSELTENAEAAKIAEEFHVSLGRADCILTAANKTGLPTDEVARMSLDELLKFQEASGIASVSVSKFISLEDAKKIAMKDAKLDELAQKIVFTREELNRNQGKPCYLLEFYTGTNQYFYQIDAKSGSIIYAGKFITLSEAKKIALDDAGCKDKVGFTEETLVSGGIKTPYYRLVFADAKTQWTYRIDAVLGIVLEKKQKETATTEIDTADFISLEEAKKIALKDAGLDEATQKIVFTREELSRNSGKPCYILEFYTAKKQYSYKVDAKDGSILEAYHFILLADAKKIALDDAGVSEKVTFTEETLVAGGIKSPYYYFAFESASARWTYKIDAVLGVIMDKTCDKIIPPAPEFIGLEKAKQIALEDAGLDEATQKIVFTREELSRNSGKPCYILEFYTAKKQYSYKVDAKNGSIMEAYHFILLADAKKIALDDAGVNVKVVFTTEELVAGGIKTPYYRFVFADTKTQWTYRIDAVLGTVLEKQQKEIVATDFISLEEAKEIALKDAGLDEATQKIVFTREELNRNSGKPCYILEFYTAKKQYSYKVDAKNGSIMEAYHFILLADAKKIALDDAGVSEKVTFTEETLVAGGIKSPYYSFAFESDTARWTYKIDAVLGSIMDKTYDKIVSPAPEFIGLEKAKQIALKDAGLDETAQKIVFTREELSRNSGKPCYILEFYTDKCAYSYKVDAVSGEIIGKKTEWFSRQESETVPDTSQNSDSKQRRGN